jgi:hypothetical protein
MRDAIASLSCQLNAMADSSLESERTHHWLRLVYFAGVEVAAPLPNALTLNCTCTASTAKGTTSGARGMTSRI